MIFLPLHFQNAAPKPVPMLIIPAIRKLSEEEITFSRNNVKKGFLEGLESLEFNGGVVYISIPTWQREAKERRMKLLAELVHDVGPDGTIDFSKLPDDIKASAFQAIWGLDAKDKTYSPPARMEANYHYGFTINGKNFDVETGKPFQPSRGQDLRQLNELVDMSKVQKMDASKLGQQASDNLYQDGIQVILQDDPHRDRMVRNLLVSSAIKRYMDKEKEDYDKFTKLMNELYAKLLSADATENVGGKGVPKDVVDRLAMALMHDDPTKYPDMDAARKAALSADCSGGWREINFSVLHLQGDSLATTRYRLGSRPIQP